MLSVSPEISRLARGLRAALHRAADAPVTLAAPDASSARSAEVAERIAPLLHRLSEHLGLRVLEIRGPRLSLREIHPALESLLGAIEVTRGARETEEREGRYWRWERVRLTLRRIHATRLILDPAATEVSVAGDRLTLPLPITDDALDSLSAPGGLCLNLLTWMPSEQISLSPVETPLIDARGRSLVAEDPEAQRQLAISFWHPAWAVGALRVPRGETRPTAFLPVERSANRPPLDLTVQGGPRTFHGESAVVWTLRSMVEEGLLLWDPRGKRFRAARGHDLTDAQRCALDRLNAVGFFDPLHRPRPDGLTPVEQVIPVAGSRRLSTVTATPPPTAVANGIFFLNFPEECDSPHAALNAPVTTLLTGGVWQSPPILRRGALTVDREGRIAIRTLHWRDVAIHFPALLEPLLPFAVSGERGIPTAVDRPRAPRGNVRLFTPWSVAHTVDSSIALTPFDPDRDRAFVIAGTEIVEEVHSPHVFIPQCGWVLVVPGDVPGCREMPSPLPVTMRRLACTWRAERDRETVHAIAAGPVLLRGGKARLTNLFERCARLGQPEQFLPMDAAWRGVSPTRFPNDVDLTRAPRTAVGIDREGRGLLAVFDGRADMVHSTGLTLRELAHAMRALGCVDALNLDGGGSSALFMPALADQRLGERIAPGIVNRPADLEGIDRVLPWPLALWTP